MAGGAKSGPTGDHCKFARYLALICETIGTADTTFSRVIFSATLLETWSVNGVLFGGGFTRLGDDGDAGAGGVLIFRWL